jgi:hypothetical protein
LKLKVFAAFEGLASRDRPCYNPPAEDLLMAKDYDILKLKDEEELRKALGVSDLAGSDVPDCAEGVILIRFNKPAPVMADDVARALERDWKGDLPVVLVSNSGFAPDVLPAVSEYEDAHLFVSAP